MQAMNQLSIPKFVLKCPWSLTENLQLQVEVTGIIQTKDMPYYCEIKTGRTYQISVVLHAGHPLVGDESMAIRLAGMLEKNPERLCCMRRYCQHPSNGKKSLSRLTFLMI